VRLGLRDAYAVREAYRELAVGVGPHVLIAPMLKGVEIALGVVVGQFGATLMVSAGGGMIELLNDRCYLLGPVNADDVERAMQDLQITRVMRATLGDSPQITALYELAARLSALGAALVGAVSELDINPVMVGEDGCVAVDALVEATSEGEAANGN
jgi:hypothetical protein